MNQRRRWCVVLAIALVVAVWSANRVPAGENLLPNPGFETGGTEETVAPPWNANGWGGAKAKLARVAAAAGGGYHFLMERENGEGGLQLMSPSLTVPAQGTGASLRLSFRYQGEGVAQLRFFRMEAGTPTPVLNPVGKQLDWTIPLKKADAWLTLDKTFKLPEPLIGEELGIRLHFMLFEKDHALAVDDVALMALAPLASQALAHEDGQEWLAVYPPQPLNAEEADAFKPFPRQTPPFGMKDGVLTRDGQPFFFGGNYTVGGGQSHAASTWLARVLDYSFVTLDWSIGTPCMDVGKNGEVLEVKYRDNAPLYSWMRELSRYGIGVQFDAGNAMYKYMPLQYFTKEFPQLNEFFVDGSHFYSLDHNTELGRQFHLNSWKSCFRHIRDTPLMAFECFNELGYTPSHPRVLEAFRVFAQVKYGSLEKANQVWKSEFADWAEVLPPHISPDASLLTSYSDKLVFLKQCGTTSMYYDWLMFVQQDLMPGLREMKKDFRTLSAAPFAVDWRGHGHEFDNYVTTDMVMLDEVVDMHFLHTSFRMYDYNRESADEESVLSALTPSMLEHEFVRRNTEKPIFNPESIHRYTATPGSSLAAMERNCFAKLHRAWKFKLDPDKNGLKDEWFNPAHDDASWGQMEVPGCWDTTDAYRGQSGWGWYRTTFNMSGAVKLSYLDGSRKFLLVGMGVAQNGTVWLNGHKLGNASGWNTKYQFDIGAFLNFGGENQITFLVNGDGYNNGLRFYLFVLGDDMLSERRALEAKEYASILWTSMMHGGSAITLWNWEDMSRPFMPQLLAEVNSVAPWVMPSVRRSRSKAALLLPFLYFHGMPHAGMKNHLDYLSYYGAMTFLQNGVDVLHEKTLLSVTPDAYPLLLVPYAKIVQPETYAAFTKYVEDGGTAVVTFDSLRQDFGTYGELGIDAFAGVEIGSDVNDPETLTFGGKPYSLKKGDRCGKYGVRMKAAGSEVIGTYADGSPAVVSRTQGKGRVVFVAARLDLPAAVAVLGAVTAQAGIAPALKLASENTNEFPYIEASVHGTPERFLVYLHNWGGQAHPLAVSLAETWVTAGSYRMRRVHCEDGTDAAGGEATTVSSAALKNGFRVVAESMNPAVLLFEAEQAPALRLAEVSPERREVLGRLAALSQNSVAPDAKAKALFLADIDTGESTVAVGPKIYPMVAEFLRQGGCATVSRPWEELTQEELNTYDLLFLGEDFSNYYSRLIKSGFFDKVLAYVEQGGSLLLVNFTVPNNARHVLPDWFGKKLGFRLQAGFCANADSCGYGDPVQIRATDFAAHPLTEGITALQFFVAPAYALSGGSPMQPVVMSGVGDWHCPSQPVVLAGEVKSGRMVTTSDLFWLQPFRIEDEDNAQFLENTLAWLLRREPVRLDDAARKARLFVTDERMTQAEARERGK